MHTMGTKYQLLIRSSGRPGGQQKTTRHVYLQQNVDPDCGSYRTSMVQFAYFYYSKKKRLHGQQPQCRRTKSQESLRANCAMPSRGRSPAPRSASHTVNTNLKQDLLG
jgi:hypothetical protein